MQTDLDWVGRDLQRLAAESKLIRSPTADEWERIWRAAIEWADAFGVVSLHPSIEPFVRAHAPGILRDDDTQTTTPPMPVVTVSPIPASSRGEIAASEIPVIACGMDKGESSERHAHERAAANRRAS